jgi:hypothetical protein
MLKVITLLVALAIAASAQDADTDEAQIWNLEKSYWEYVKANDLEKYRALWHEDFLGWPFVSSEPMGKNHITDWITMNTSKGLRLQSYSIEQLAVRDRRHRDQLLSDQGELGHGRNSQSAHGCVADYAHLDPYSRHVANSRRHVRSCERKGSIVIVTT